MLPSDKAASAVDSGDEYAVRNENTGEPEGTGVSWYPPHASSSTPLLTHAYYAARYAEVAAAAAGSGYDCGGLD